MTVRECQKCFVEFPLTDDYFHKDRTKEAGYKMVCKMCRAEQHKAKEDKKIDDRIKKLEANGIKVLDELVSGGSNIPHMAETFQHIISAFGGSIGFAQHFLGNYLSTEPGSATRQKMLNMVLQLNVKVSESGAAKRSLEEITDEELDLEIQKTARALLLDAPVVNTESSEEVDAEQLD